MEKETKTMNQIPIPKRMRALGRDERGYPIPFIVMREPDSGRPLFVVNDAERQIRAVKEKRCPICGSHLDSLIWWVGGPLSAFLEAGAYNDSGMHYECMEYALQVCPYLAMPNYLGSLTELATKQAMEAGVATVIDHTMLPGRPAVFVAVAARRFTLIDHGAGYYSKPEQPYIAIQYWRHGKLLDPAAARELIKAQPLPQGKR
jgi:hypothetical protein